MLKKRGFEVTKEESSESVGNSKPVAADVSTVKEATKRPLNPPFKNPNFRHSNLVTVGSQKKRKPWKTLKQLLAVEQSLPWPSEAVTYSSLEAPPSFLPARKYSDLSGCEAHYTDPHTRLHFATPEEFQEIRKLPGDILQGYLALRKANTQLQ